MAWGRRQEQVERSSDPAEVLPKYVEWLKGHIDRGGSPTHYYDFPFEDFEYQRGGTVVVDSDHEYGAGSRRIVVGEGTTVETTKPGGGWGHTTLYRLGDESGQYQPGYVPVYSDSAFDAVLTEQHQRTRAVERQRDETLRLYGDIPYEPFNPGPPPGAETGPTETASTTDAGTTSADPGTTQAFTAAFGTPESPTTAPAADAIHQPASTDPAQRQNSPKGPGTTLDR